jgi:Leucine-rich repeat (LRR) protein
MKKRNNHDNEDKNDLQTIIDGLIGEDFIIRETGINNLSKIFHLTLKIDTSTQSIYELGDLLPNLKSLVLDNCKILSVRDLGLSLSRIVSLSLGFCGLNDIDGLGAFTGLKELNLHNNNLVDVTPLAMHENLQVEYMFRLSFHFC